MKKTYLTLVSVICLAVTSQAQIKVYSGGNTAFGSTTSTPSKPIDVFGAGGIQISRTDSSNNPHNNELFFQDFGQIRSKDDNHRIVFDRGSNILEFLEFGDIVFSANAVSGARTNTARITKAGNINITSLTNGYQINGSTVLWQNNSSTAIFVGVGAGSSNTATGITATGYNALHSNTSGAANSAFGYSALSTNATGSYNSAFGYNALSSNTGSYNSAFGYKALTSNSSGTENTAVGYYALENNSSGSNNTAIGYEALQSTTGADNTGLGYAAGFSNTTGHHNTFVGYLSVAGAATYTNCAAFGNGALVGANDEITLGNSSITQIGGYQAWTNLSDGRFKTNVTENVKGLAFIKKLRPITYNINTEALDDFMIQNLPDSIKNKHKEGMDFTASKNMIHSGFIAQEVEQVAQQVGFASSIVSRPANSSDPYALSYSEFVVPLVKAVQELAGTVDSLKQALAQCCNASSGSSNRTLQNPGFDTQPTDGTGQKATSSINSNTNSINAVLYQNNPNPFSQTTAVKCFIPQSSQNASLLIFDLNGSLKKTIALNGKGELNTTINGRELIAGMYFYTLLIDGVEIDTKKMILTE